MGPESSEVLDVDTDRGPDVPDSPVGSDGSWKGVHRGTGEGWCDGDVGVGRELKRPDYDGVLGSDKDKPKPYGTSRQMHGYK